MASFVFFIVTTFQIWACHITCVYKLAKNFISRDTLLNFRKVTKCELHTCTGSRVIKNFFKSPPSDGIGSRVKICYFLIGCKGHTVKYQARGSEVRTE